MQMLDKDGGVEDPEQQTGNDLLHTSYCDLAACWAVAAAQFVAGD